LKRELDDVAKEYSALSDKSLSPINAGLKAKGLPEIGAPPSAQKQAQLSSGEIRNAFARFFGQSVQPAVTSQQVIGERD
ncbi:MAG: hypothetical protein ABI451_12260, partial [Dokdonella sp.]